MGDENHENGLASSAIGGREQDQNTPAARHGFLRGSGPDQQAHEQQGNRLKKFRLSVG